VSGGRAVWESKRLMEAFMEGTLKVVSEELQVVAVQAEQHQLLSVLLALSVCVCVCACVCGMVRLSLSRTSRRTPARCK